MGGARRKLLPVTPKAQGQAAHRWVESFVNYLRSECHLADNSVAAYTRDINRFRTWLGARAIADLAVRDLTDYAAWLNQKQLAPPSVARHIVALRLFFRYLQLEGVLRDSPAELLGSQKLW